MSEMPTLEGRALADLGQQLAAMRAERDAARARVQRLEAAITAARVALGCWQTSAHERVADADQILMRAALAAKEGGGA